MPSAATSRLTAGPDGWWWLRGWSGAWCAAGIGDRRVESGRLPASLPIARAVGAEQVHGGSVAMMRASSLQRVAGCDALLTNVPGLGLLVRTADCLPIVFADPVHQVVGLAHAGWRGLLARLPARVVAAFRHWYHSRPEELRVAIGPAIRACCYEVGVDFRARFGRFVTERRGRRTCDLAGAAVDQLQHCGVSASRILDTRRCTACEPAWWSLRRDGAAAGRMTSLVMVRP